MRGFEWIYLHFLLETSPIPKVRKRTQKVLHPIATDTEPSSSPARRARLLNPGMLKIKSQI